MKFKTQVVFSSILVAALVVLIVYFTVRDLQQAGWERLLISFPGKPFTGNIEEAPASSLHLSDGYSLLLYQQGANHPVLAMQSQTGSRLWQQALIPEVTGSGHSTRSGKIHNLDFKRAKKYRDGIKIYISCDWHWGGTEGGIIYIGPDHTFQKFALSW